MTRAKAASAIEENVTELNREAFDVALELQMSFLSSASAFAEEFADFATRHAALVTEEMRDLSAAATPAEALQIQLTNMRKMFDIYVAETGKLLDMTNSAVTETAAAVVSGIPKSDV